MAHEETAPTLYGLMAEFDTPDALLVCPKDRAQDVKKLVEELEKRGRRELL